MPVYMSPRCTTGVFQAITVSCGDETITAFVFLLTVGPVSGFCHVAQLKHH